MFGWLGICLRTSTQCQLPQVEVRHHLPSTHQFTVLANMLLANYGSDSDSDDSGPSSPPPKGAPVTAPAPAPKAGVVKKRKPVKIGLGIEPVEQDKVPGKGRSATSDAEVEEDRGVGGKRKLGGAGR